MSSFFYAKLAVTNIKKNRVTYVPYMISCIGIVFIFFLFVSIATNPGMKNVPDHYVYDLLMNVGKYVAMIFSVIFIFYTNSFLMKKRKKEIGLYGILGLEKRHVAIVMLWESVIVAIASIGIGMASGFVFGKLFFLILTKLSDVSKESSYQITIQPILMTLLLFSCIYFLTFVWNFIQIKMNNPISLLRSENTGEKEPRAPILITIIGVLSLGGGYYIAITTQSILTAITNFILAVILVIIGTYAIFTSGSITFLKLMRKNKKFYYKTKNFVSLSNMIYRMKKNAVGLANICLLSTIVIVIMSTTILLYTGIEQMLAERYPDDYVIEIAKDIDNQEDVLTHIEQYADEYNIAIKDQTSYVLANYMLYLEDGALISKSFDEYDVSSLEAHLMNMYDVVIIEADEYRRMTNQDIRLAQDEAIVYTNVDLEFQNSLTLLDFTYKIRTDIEDKYYSYLERIETQLGLMNTNSIIIVLESSEDIQIISQRYREMNPDSANGYLIHYYTMNLIGDNQNKVAFGEAIRDWVYVTYPGSAASGIDIMRESWNSIYGGLLFLGILLGILFISAFVLIIYFKQVSEGYEDQGRFQILEKVGMDKRDVKNTIYKQIKLVFGLPIITAFVHMVAAYPILCKLLSMFGLVDETRIMLGLVIVCVIFAIFYAVVYLMTAKVYNKILSSNQF